MLVYASEYIQIAYARITEEALEKASYLKKDLWSETFSLTINIIQTGWLSSI